MSKRATSDDLDALHAFQAATLMAEVKKYTDAVDAEGKPAPQPVPPALLSQINKFLKDNGIDSPARAKKVEDALGRRMPDLEDVEHEHDRPTH